MVDFAFYALQPKWIKPDRFYKVYVTRDVVLGARIAGQFWSWRSAFAQLLIFAPLAYWPLRASRRREILYDRLVGNPQELLARDRRNFSLPYRLIRRAQPTTRWRSWTALCGGSTLTLDLANHGLLDLIVIEPDTSDDVADRLGKLGYADVGVAPWALPLPDDGNPYRAPQSA